MRIGGLTVIAALVVGAFGCGGGSDGGNEAPATTATTASLSRDDYVKRGNAICRRAEAELGERIAAFRRERAVRDSRKPYTDMVHSVLLPTIESELGQLHLLPVPRGDEEKVDEMLFALQIGIDNVAVIPRVPSSEVAERHFAKASRLLRAYGLSACAYG